MGSEPAFAAEIESRNGVIWVGLSGELDMSTAPILTERLAPLAADGVASIMLDIRDLRFIDCSGLRVLLKASQRAETNGHRILVVGATRAARRLFELTGTQFLIGEQDAGSAIHPFARNNGHRTLRS